MSLSPSFLEYILDELPIATIILSKHLEFIRCNNAADRMFNLTGNEGKRLGDIFCCVNAENSKNSCGSTPYCKNCEITLALKKTLTTDKVIRCRGILSVQGRDKLEYMYILVTAKATHFNEKKYVIMNIQDISKIQKSQGFITMCSNCKQVFDNHAWKSFEAFIEDTSGAQVTHTICSGCIKKLYPEYADKILDRIVKENSD